MSVVLLDLAKDTSSDKRRETLLAVSQLFVDGAEHHTDRELVLFGDVLGRLLDSAGTQARASVARQIAVVDQTPHGLALKLAQDEAEVAAPVLQFSKVLHEQDLVDIARSRSQGHLLAIAQRESVPETVSDVIVDRGESTVLKALVSNLGAMISVKAYAVLGKKALGSPGLGDALTFRKDLPADVAQAILGVLNIDARLCLTHLLKYESERAAELLRRAYDVVGTARGEQRRNRQEVSDFVDDVRCGDRAIDEALDHFVLQKRMVDVAAFLADLASLDESHVSNVLHKINATGIGIVCRSLHIGQSAYERLSRLRCEKLKLPISQSEQMNADYRGIDQVTAERSLRFHKVRNATQG